MTSLMAARAADWSTIFLVAAYACALAEEHALTMPALAQELSYRLPRLRLLLGQETANSRSCRFVSRRRA
jgi:hypothetical protein